MRTLLPCTVSFVVTLVVVSIASPAALAGAPELPVAASRADIARSLATHLQAAPPLGATPQIIGGSDAPAGPFPYAVYVETDYTVGGQPAGFSCTGSLIAPMVVLTAGHCAFDSATGAQLPASVYGLVLGLTDLSAPIPMGNIRFITSVLPYPYYNQSTAQGDAALLILDQAAPAGATPIPLATTANASLYAPGQPATVLGWGITSNGPSAVSPDVLQFATVAVQTNATCTAQAPSALPYHAALDLCAAAPGYLPAACHGDSGGPLVVATAAGPVEIGVVSYGNQPCATGPDYYARASSIQPWVAAVIAGAPIPPPFVPPFAAPAATAALAADGVTVSFPPPVADPATIPTGFLVSLISATGALVAQQNLPVTATAATFPALQPGGYAAVVVAVYSEGASAGAVSNAVMLDPPANRQRPAIKGDAFVGSTLTCRTGAWEWPGASTLATVWLRNGAPTARTTATYKVGSADAGKKIACRVTLTAATGARAGASSTSLLAGVKLRAKSLPALAGARTLGAVLTCAAGTWAHSGTLKVRYRWLRNGKPIAGSAGASAKHKLSAADIGRRLACRVSVSATGQTASKTTPPLTLQAASV